MTFAIALRVYRLSVRAKGEKNPLGFRNGGGPLDLFKALNSFVDNHREVTNLTGKQRSWCFTPAPTNNPQTVYGLVDYGTYGFKSHIVDLETGEIQFTRESTHSEQIPLFFLFDVKAGDKSAFAVFQSFQARSCMQIILDRLAEWYKESFPGYLLDINPLMPAAVIDAAYGDAQVRQLTLVKRSVPHDKADHYLKGAALDLYDLKLVMRARKKGFFGALRSVLPKSQADADALLQYKGIEFSQAKAEVQIGNRKRTVGLFGFSGDTGSVDITESVSKGPDGHPTMESILDEATHLISSYREKLNLAA